MKDWIPFNLPDHLPSEWEEHPSPLLPKELHGTRAQRTWRHNKIGMIVLADCTFKDDGKLWRHVSFSFQDRMPTYEEISEVKRLFIGPRKALFILPDEANHVNIHSYCLHLWSCEEDDGLPEFSTVLPKIGKSI